MPLDYIKDADIAGQASQSLIGKAGDAVIATTADVASTLWNSTLGLLGADDISTQDILKKVSKDALHFYNEHEEGVKAASFVAGIIAPGLATTKILNAYRVGRLATGRAIAGENIGLATIGQPLMAEQGLASTLFSGYKAEQYQADLVRIFAAGRKETSDHYTTLAKLFGAKIGENVIDSVILETVMVGTLNAHPYMEEYRENFFSTAAFSIALGGAAGAGFGMIGANMAVKKATGPVLTKATQLITDAIVPERMMMTNAQHYQQHAETVGNLEGLAKRAELNKLEQGMVADSLVKVKADQEEALVRLAPFLGPTIDAKSGKPVPSIYGELRPIIEAMGTDPRFAHVQRISLPNMKTANPNSPFIHDFDIVEFGKKTETVDGKVKVVEDTRIVYYDPALKNVYDKKGAANAAGAANLKGYKVGVRRIELTKVNNNFDMGNLLRGESAAAIDAKFMDSIYTWNKFVSKHHLENIPMDPSDLPTLHGAYSMLKGMNDIEKEGLIFNITSNQATYSKITKFLENTMKPGYEQDITNLIEHGGVTFADKGVAFDSPAGKMLGQWIHGSHLKGGETGNIGVGAGKAQFRRAMDAFIRGTKLPAGEEGNEKIAEQIWKAGEAFREEARKHADAEGFIYLWRGIGGQTKGHSAGQSYTSKPVVAADFGDNVTLSRVHVDHIIGTIGSGAARDAEVIVDAPAHAVVKDIPFAPGKRYRTPAEAKAADEAAKEASKTLSAHEKSILAKYREDAAHLTPAETDALKIRYNVNSKGDVDIDALVAKETKLSGKTQEKQVAKHLSEYQAKQEQLAYVHYNERAAKLDPSDKKGLRELKTQIHDGYGVDIDSVLAKDKPGPHGPQFTSASLTDEDYKALYAKYGMDSSHSELIAKDALAKELGVDLHVVLHNPDGYGAFTPNQKEALLEFAETALSKTPSERAILKNSVNDYYKVNIDKMLITARNAEKALEKTAKPSKTGKLELVKGADEAPLGSTKSVEDRIEETATNAPFDETYGDLRTPGGTPFKSSLGDAELAALKHYHEDIASLSTKPGGLTRTDIEAVKQDYARAGHHIDTIEEINARDMAGAEAYATKTESNVDFKGTASDHSLDVKTLKEHIDNETERQAREMMKHFYEKDPHPLGFEEMSLRLNIKPAALLALSEGSHLKDLGDWMRMSSVEDTEKAMGLSNRMLVLQGNPHTNFARASMAKSANDTRNADTLERELLNVIAAKYKSGLVRSVMGMLNPVDNPDRKAFTTYMIDQVDSILGQVNNAIVGSPFLQTAGQAMRHVTHNEWFTRLGKDIVDARDQAVKILLEPLSIAYRGFKNDIAAVNEFSNVNNKLAAIEGYKDIVVSSEYGKTVGTIVYKKTVEGKEILETLKNKDGTTFYINSPATLNALEAMRAPMREIFEAHNFHREIRGHPPLKDIGFYAAPMNLENKHIAYVIDSTHKEDTMMLIGNSAEELTNLEVAYKEQFALLNPNMRIVTKGFQKEYNTVNGYLDGDPFMKVANTRMKHKGVTAAHPPADARMLDDIMAGYEHQMTSIMRKTQEAYLNPIMQKLEHLAGLNQKFEAAQPTKGFFKKNAPDAARTAKNILLGQSQIGQFTTWKAAEDFTDMCIVTATQAADKFAGLFSKELGSEKHFQELNREMTQRGIMQPWETYELFQASQKAPAAVKPQRMVSTANGMMALMQIRAMDAAHAFVNMASWPILTSGAIMAGLPKTVLPNGESLTLPMKLILDAPMFSYSAKGKEMHAEWKGMGKLDQATKQYRDLNAALNGPVESKGAISALMDQIAEIQNSKTANFLSKPADWSEGMVREWSMNAGYLAAKHAYPGIGDTGATMHAIAFADRIAGNYHSAQRPAVFQGTLGSALGLYQTYMTTYAQSAWNMIERKQFKALSVTMLAQAGVFGTSSWPGYQMLSNAIGSNMSQDNWDLTTGTYRALPDTAAQLVLYGMPSMLGPALSTRGAVNPRIPIPELPIYNTVTASYNALSHLYNGVINQPGMPNKMQALGEALSLQTLNRPIARVAEIATGESITQRGNTVANSDNVWTFTGIASRLLATRPLEEQITRDAMHLNSYYGAQDRDNRMEAVRKLRIAIRGAGDEHKSWDETVEKVAKGYLRHGGTARGWESVMTEIRVRTEEGTSYELLRKLEPNAPLQRMIRDTY